MAKEVATPKETSGSPFTFEEKVGANYLLKMLAKQPPLNSADGLIENVQFQTRVDGWHLDDLVLDLVDSKQKEHQLAISVKSSVQIDKGGFPKDFATAIWELWLHKNTAKFNADSDYLALATVPIEVAVSRAWQSLLNKAVAADAALFPGRLATPNYANAIERSIFASLNCPDSVDSAQPHTETVKLIRRLRHLEFDFENSPSNSEINCIFLCKYLLQDPDEPTAESLWLNIRHVAREISNAGGAINRQSLIDRLLVQFNFKEYPDYEGDWLQIDEETESRLGRVRGDLAGRTKLELSVPQTSGLKALVGASGSGKSAIAKEVALEIKRTGRVVWLEPRDLNRPGMAAVLRDLGLRHSLSTLLSQSLTSSGLLVFDAVEKLDSDGVKNLGELLRKTVMHGNGSSWSVLFTSVVDGWERFFGALSREVPNLPSITVDTIEFSFAKHREAVINEFPEIRNLLFQKHLSLLFSNLKLLDLITSNARSTTSFDSWIGETNVIDWFWDEYVANGANGQARSRLLQNLGRQEADDFRAGLPIDMLESDESRLLRDLQHDQIITCHDEQVCFQHDLLGDWSRSRFLLGRRHEFPSLVAEKSVNPRWHRAIRLFGLRQLESRTLGTESWMQTVHDLSSDGKPKIELDLILESVLFAANMTGRLEEIWEHLLANESLLLNRLLNRFLYTGTLPDPRYQAKGYDANCASLFRVPYWPMWMPLLEVLHRKRLDCFPHAIENTSKIAAMWVEHSDDGWPLRDECAQILIDATLQVVEYMRVDMWGLSSDSSKSVFQRLLIAADVRPDEVADIALKLCERREDSFFSLPANNQNDDEPDDSILGRSLPTEEMLFGPRGPLADPWTDGPLRSISYGVRDGFLATNNSLKYLFAKRPDEAIEVLLACLIREPLSTLRHGQGTELREFLHVQDMHEWSPAMYFRGPFLTFLQLNWQKGIEAIVQLTNFVTDRWLENRKGKSEAVVAAVGGVETKCFGGQDAYFWYRDSFRTPDAVGSALMALERWLYLMVDEGKSVTDPISQIFSTSRSTALLGLLAALANKKPELLKAELLPLASIWQLQVWEENHRIKGHDKHWGMTMMEWTRWGESMFNTVRDWHSLSHRSNTFGTTMLTLFFNDGDFRCQMSGIQQTWATELLDRVGSEYYDALEKIAIQFDVKNWTAKPTEGGVQLELVEPPDRTARLSASREWLAKRMAVLQFPWECRSLIDKRTKLSVVKLQEFWERLKAIGDDASEFRKQGEEPEHAILGGIAVLYMFHEEWLDSDPQKVEWCGKQFAETLESRPPGPESDVANSISNTFWRNFAAMIAIKDLASDPSDRNIRAFCAQFALHYSHTVVQDLMDFAFEYRSKLGDDFLRLQRIAVVSSGLRNVHEVTQSGNSIWLCRNTKFDIDEEFSQLISAFIDSSIPIQIPDLREIGEASTSQIIDLLEQDRSQVEPSELHPRVRNRIERSIGFELEHLRAAFAWLSRLSEINDTAEQQKYAAILLENILLGVLRPLGGTEEAIRDSRDRDDDYSFYCHPREIDNWLFNLLAASIPLLEQDDQREKLWKPIMKLGLDRFHWTESFLSSWFRHGLSAVGKEDNFFTEWQAMVQFAWDQPNWFTTQARNNESHSSLFLALMGYNRFGPYVLQEDRFTPYITKLKGQYVRWASHWLPDPEAVRGIAVLLAWPSFSGLRRTGLQLIAESVPEFRERHWRDHYHIDSALLNLLELNWRENKRALIQDSTARSHFTTILKALTDRQIPRALELQDQVVRTLR